MIGVVPHFDIENNNWYVVIGHDESDLPAYMEAEIEDFNKCMDFNENEKCERAVFLVNERDIYDEEKDLVENSDFILTYNKKSFANRFKNFFIKEVDSFS